MPAAVANADVSGSDLTYQGQLSYTCDTGYANISGDLSRTCQANSNWTGTPPVCEGEQKLTHLYIIM